MNNFNVFLSNSQNILSEYLINIIYSTQNDPFQKEKIIVQSAGMAKWLQLKLAKKKKVCFNVDFIFPGNFLNELLENTGVKLKENKQKFLSADNILLLIMQKLPYLIENESDFFSIKNYLGDEEDFGIKLYNLSTKIGYLFDQYIIYRPDIIKCWKNNELFFKNNLDEKWQMKLFNAVTEGLFTRADYYEKFINEFEIKDDTLLPERISIFGISSLPPYYINILNKFSEFAQVNLFFLNPCKEYWGDLKSPKVKAKEENKYDDTDIPAELLHYEEGNELLVFLGKVGQDLFNILNYFDFHQVEKYFLKENSKNTLLEYIKTDITFLSEKIQKQTINDKDNSIQIHACHGKVRELEIIKNTVLNIITENQDISTSDIIVMAPDIEEYTPYIHGVFSKDEHDDYYLNYSVSDNTLSRESKVISLFLFMLEFAGSRFKINDFLKIITDEVIVECFGISKNDIEYIKKWIFETNIRWGADNYHRKEVVDVSYEDFSFEQGLNRMFAGYAMNEKNKQFLQIFPYDEIEGTSSRVLGFIAELVSNFKILKNMIEHEKTLSEWIDSVLNCFDFLFVQNSSFEKEKNYLNKFLISLKQLSEKNNKPDFNISYNVFRQFVEDRVGVEKIERGFLSGGITFSSMLPMRSIPFKVVCLLGMNNDTFPRKPTIVNFDLMSVSRRFGDRNSRESDKYLFLEALLSAQDYFILTYDGIDYKDNSEKVAAITVTSLSDYIDKYYKLESNKEILNKIFFKHKMQPFNPEYFKENANFKSYSKKYYKIANKIANNTFENKDKFSFECKKPLEQKKENSLITNNDLESFYYSPSRFFVEKIMGIFLKESDEVFDDNESFKLSKKHKFIKKYTDIMLSNSDITKSAALNKELNYSLPPLGFGEIEKEKILKNSDDFYNSVYNLICDKKEKIIEHEIDFDGFKFYIKLNNYFQNMGLVNYYPASIYASTIIKIWLNHVLLNVISDDIDGITPKSFFVSNKEVKEFDKINNAKEILKNLITYFLKGSSSPLKFFPDSSMAYYCEKLKNIQKGKELKEAVLIGKNNAYKKWFGNSYLNIPGDKDNPYVNFLFKHQKALIDSEDFVQTAENILQGFEQIYGKF
ncbi:MAG: exodeoxyribonuclease V subunit gamma [Candidatus Muiribacteriota bacterium]